MKHIITALALAANIPAQAEFWTGNDLMERLTSERSFHQGMALGYVMGVFDAGLQVTHCPPANVTAGQISDMVLKTLRDLPEHRAMTADVIVNATLGLAWPCRSAGKKKGQGV